MKFELHEAKYTPRSTDPLPGKTTRDGDRFYIEINSLEELLSLSDSVGCDVIVNRDSIWIYNG